VTGSSFWTLRKANNEFESTQHRIVAMHCEHCQSSHFWGVQCVIKSAITWQHISCCQLTDNMHWNTSMTSSILENSKEKQHCELWWKPHIKLYQEEETYSNAHSSLLGCYAVAGWVQYKLVHPALDDKESCIKEKLTEAHYISPFHLLATHSTNSKFKKQKLIKEDYLQGKFT